MNPYQKTVFTAFALGLAVLIFVETRVLYTGETIPIIAIRSPAGSEYMLILKDGGLAVWRIIGNGVWILLAGIAALVWATPMKRRQDEETRTDPSS